MALDLKRIRALCFDVDGTLSDTDDQWVRRLGGFLKPANRILPRWNTYAFARWLVMGLESPANVMYMTLDMVGLDDNVAWLYNRWMQHRRKQKKHQYLMIPGVQDALASLSGRYPMSVVSARDSRSTLQFLEQNEIRPYFKAVATSQTCEHTKPFPDPVLWAAQQMGIDPQECLMIGDTVVDIRAGKAAGAQTVGVLCGFGWERELRRAGADLVLSSTACLKDVLLSGQDAVE